MTSPPNLRGAEEPRVKAHPPYSKTFGGLAGKLMAAAGKPLERWQQDAVDVIMSVPGEHDRKWLCFEYAEWVARQNGKGGIGEARVLAGFLVLGEKTIIWSAHEVRTAKTAFKRFQELFRALGTAVGDTEIVIDGVRIKVNNSHGQEGFERLDTGATILFNSRSKNALRGFSVDLLVIDEAYAYTAEQQDAILPTTAARPNAQVVYLSSPPLTGDTGEVMFALKARAESGNSTRLGYRDWGIEGFLDDIARLDLDSHQNWAQANPALGNGRVTAQTIKTLREAMKANEGRGFGREVLGLWPRRIEGGGAIDMELWNSLLAEPGQNRGRDLAIGVDISPKRDYAAIVAYGHTETGLGHLMLYDYRPGTDWLVSRIVEIRNALNPIAIGMGRSCGASLSVDLEKLGITVPEERDEPRRGDLAIANATELTAATGQIVDAIRQKTLVHTGKVELDASVEGAAFRKSGESLTWARGDSNSDTSPIVAATMARWAFESRAHLIDKNDEPFHVW